MKKMILLAMFAIFLTVTAFPMDAFAAAKIVSTMGDKIKNSPQYKLNTLRKAWVACAARQKDLEATAPAGLAVKKTEFTRIKAAIKNLKTQSLKTDITNVLKYTPQEEAYLNALTPLVAECKAAQRAYAVYAMP